MKFTFKGEVMQKHYSAVVLALVCILGLGVTAQAQDAGGVIVKVPFEFVAGGKTLPAGTYRVSRVSPETQPGLFIRSDKDGAMLLPTVFDGAAAEQSELSFAHVGDKYFLSKVGTPAGVYTIATPRAMTQLAQKKNHAGMSSSGAN
jgi:hypothetical protein